VHKNQSQFTNGTSLNIGDTLKDKFENRGKNDFGTLTQNLSKLNVKAFMKEPHVAKKLVYDEPDP
jgi:hypothetical protein